MNLKVFVRCGVTSGLFSSRFSLNIWILFLFASAMKVLKVIYLFQYLTANLEEKNIVAVCYIHYLSFVFVDFDFKFSVDGEHSVDNLSRAYNDISN